MTSPSKRKGNGYERELVKQFQDSGFTAKRAWGSNGQSLGEHEEVDLIVDLFLGQYDRNVPPNPYTEAFKIQAKRRKELPKFLGLTDKVDASVFREDNGKSYIMMPLDLFIKEFLAFCRLPLKEE